MTIRSVAEALFELGQRSRACRRPDTRARRQRSRGHVEATRLQLRSRARIRRRADRVPLHVCPRLRCRRARVSGRRHARTRLTELEQRLSDRTDCHRSSAVSGEAARSHDHKDRRLSSRARPARPEESARTGGAWTVGSGAGAGGGACGASAAGGGTTRVAGRAGVSSPRPRRRRVRCSPRQAAVESDAARRLRCRRSRRMSRR